MMAGVICRFQWSSNSLKMLKLNSAIFDNGCKNVSIWGKIVMSVPGEKPDLVYIDPPYYSPLSDNEYVRRYHFVEGLARDWKGVEFQDHTKTKKFKWYPTCSHRGMGLRLRLIAFLKNTEIVF